jgi:hypothetical protein
LLVALVGSTILLDGPPRDLARLDGPPILRWSRDTVNAVTRKDWTFGTLMVCLDRPGRVEIREVVPDGDLTVTGFATRPNPMARGELGVGSVAETLEAQGLSAQPLTLVCDGGGRNLHEIVVELRAGARTTSTKGFTIHYESEGLRLQRYYDKEIILCVDEREGVCPWVGNAA